MYKYRSNYFHPIPFFTIYWLITFPFKYILYESYESYIVGYYIDDSIRTVSLGWSLLYYLCILVSYSIFERKRPVYFPMINQHNGKNLMILWCVGLLVFLSLNIPLMMSGNIAFYLSNRVETYSGHGFYKVFG